ncbi:MAG: hypothetical protein ACFFE4_18165 [Candidatus Thorarchaeota archaeon]
MKKTKIILLAAVCLCIISFIPAVAAKANVRPIEDFTATNDYVAAWVDPETNIIIFPHGFFVTPWGMEVISDCEHSGSILEKELKDGRIMYKINLHVKGAYMLAGDAGINPYVFEGEMDYFCQVTIILYEGELGDPVPNLLEIWFPDYFLPPGSDPIGEGVSSHLTGSGTGEFLVDAFGFTAGETAKVKVNQVSLFGDVFWPVEIVFFH